MVHLPPKIWRCKCGMCMLPSLSLCLPKRICCVSVIYLPMHHDRKKIYLKVNYTSDSSKVICSSVIQRSLICDFWVSRVTLKQKSHTHKNQSLCTVNTNKYRKFKWLAPQEDHQGQKQHCRLAKWNYK